jgi:RND superfamily putative drug exporter
MSIHVRDSAVDQTDRSWMSRRVRWVIAVSWVAILAVALPFAARINNELDASVRLQGSESTRVDETLLRRFESPFTKIALLHMTMAPSPRTAEGRVLLAQVTDALRGTPGVLQVASYLDREDMLFLGLDGSPIIVVGVSSARNAGALLMRNLRAATDTLSARFRKKYPGVSFQWTGESAVSADMRRLSADETRTAELRVLPFTLLLLLVAFRSWIAALLPLLGGVLTIVVSLGALEILNRSWPVSTIVLSIISMVGLGLSIDYALLIVSRYRDVVDAGESRDTAVAIAGGEGGRTVLVSGSAVAIGFAAMLFVPVSEVRSIGIGGLLVTGVAVLVAVTLLPVLLAWVGARIDLGRRRAMPPVSRGRVWRRWADYVTRHPVGVLMCAGIPLLLLAGQATRLHTELPRGRWLPETAESVRVLHEIDAVARGNFGQIMPIILNLPADAPIQSEAGWRAESRLVRFFARDPRIQHVWAVTTLSTVPLTGPEILQRLPESVRHGLVSDDSRATLLQLLPKSGLTATDAVALVREIRAADPQTLTGLAGTRLDVGGVPGFNVDYADAIGRSLPRILLGVIGATVLALSLAFRSILIPFKAVALNLLSVAASFGAVAVVFQSAIGAQLVGLPRPLDGSFPIIPLLVFCIVFGLSMDYEVFILSRIVDGRRAGLSDAQALAEGLVGTGRVIGFAAAIMVSLFAAFVFGEFVLIKILGFALSVAVFLDATVVRLALGPALIHLAGRWNWWPGRRPEKSPLL